MSISEMAFYLDYGLDESYKTADWSVRPLSADMLELSLIHI